MHYHQMHYYNVYCDHIPARLALVWVLHCIGGNLNILYLPGSAYHSPGSLGITSDVHLGLHGPIKPTEQAADAVDRRRRYEDTQNIHILRCHLSSLVLQAIKSQYFVYPQRIRFLAGTGTV